MNNYCSSGRISRSLEEAFGPHCNTEITDLAPSLFSKGGMVVMVVCMVAVAFLVLGGVL